MKKWFSKKHPLSLNQEPPKKYIYIFASWSLDFTKQWSLRYQCLPNLKIYVAIVQKKCQYQKKK